SSPFFHPTVLVEREALETHGLRYDPLYLESEDYDLWSRLLEVADGANLGLPLVLKRVHLGQASLRRRDLQASFQRKVALREMARVAPELSAAEGERAWSFGSGRDKKEGRDAYVALLEAFVRRYGVDSEVQQLATRSLGPPGPRLVARRIRRQVDERRARRRATDWLGALVAPSDPLRVAVVSPEPTPYRSPLFDRIAARSEVDLTVIYAARTVAGRTWWVEPRHRAVFLKGVRVPGLRRLLRHDYPVTPGIADTLRRAQPHVVVVSGWSTFPSQRALAWCRAHRIPYVLLVESHDLGPRPGWRRAVKGAVVPRVVRGGANVLVVGSAARESVLARGGRPDRIRIFANTVDVSAWTARAERLAAQPTTGGEVVVLSVGRLAPEKGLETLLRAAAQADD